VQDALVGLYRQIKLIVCFLDVTQADGRPYVDDDIAGCLADSHGFGVGPAGCGTVSLKKGHTSRIYATCFVIISSSGKEKWLV